MADDDAGAKVRGLTGGATRRQELIAFLALAVLIWPVLAIGVVGGWGFLVWMAQLVFGPPGPPQ